MGEKSGTGCKPTTLKGEMMVIFALATRFCYWFQSEGLCGQVLLMQLLKVLLSATSLTAPVLDK